MQPRRGLLPITCVVVGLGVLAPISIQLGRRANAEEFVVGALRLVPLALGLMALGIGAVMYTFQRRLRVGSAPSCRRCGYPYPDTEKLIKVCCECGAPWRWYGGLVKGTPIHTENVRRVGLALALIGLPLTLLALTPTSLVVSVTPTRIVAARLALAPDTRAGVWWNELDLRQLSPTQREAIAVHLLDRRQSRGELGVRSARWLEESVTRLPTQSIAVRRYANEVAAPATNNTLASRTVRAPASPTPPITLAAPRPTPASTPAPSSPERAVEEFLASLRSFPTGAIADASPEPGKIPAWRRPMANDMRHDGWLDELLGAGGASGAWSIDLHQGSLPDPVPYLSLGEVREQISARRAGDAWLSRQVHLAPSSISVGWSLPPP